MFLISNAANAADKWEYVNFTRLHHQPGVTSLLSYPDGKADVWTEKEIKPPKGFQALALKRWRHTTKGLAKDVFDKMLQKDFSKPINVINILGELGFEMLSHTTIFDSNGRLKRETFWFKRKL